MYVQCSAIQVQQVVQVQQVQQVQPEPEHPTRAHYSATTLLRYWIYLDQWICLFGVGRLGSHGADDRDHAPSPRKHGNPGTQIRQSGLDWLRGIKTRESGAPKSASLSRVEVSE